MYELCGQTNERSIILGVAVGITAATSKERGALVVLTPAVHVTCALAGQGASDLGVLVS